VSQLEPKAACERVQEVGAAHPEYDTALGLAHNFARDPAFEWTELVFRMVNGAVMRDLEDDTQGAARTHTRDKEEPAIG
jgi:hypothetical protein